LDDRDKLILSKEIEKLFVLQDRPISRDKNAILVEELSHSGFPLAPLLAGLRKLMSEDLKNIKLTTIIQAAEDFIVRVPDANQCSECASGFIVAKDGEGRLFSLACRCPAGDRKKLKRWTGESTQLSNGRLLTVLSRG
jgi:hypothetical protein